MNSQDDPLLLHLFQYGDHYWWRELGAAHCENQSVDVRTRSHQVQPEKSDIFRFQGSELPVNSGAEAAEFSAM